MDKYIADLMAMIQEAYGNKPISFQNIEDPEDIIAEVQSYLNGNTSTVEEAFGITQIYFPPEEKLTDAHLDLLVPEFEALWNHFQFDLCFPKGITNRWKYILMRKELVESHPVSKSENCIIGIEFCSYERETCVLPIEFCCCRDEEQ